VVAVRVRDQRAIDWFPRIDVKAAARTVEASRRRFN
jgi:hypothetical protein